MTEDEITYRAESLLKRFFGYSTFRPSQLDIITTAVSGRDTLVLMPTGGGKSICYQIPALMGSGCTIVISPLIALMKDQVMSLVANGIPAASVNSNQSDADNRQIMQLVGEKQIKLLYISPERLLADVHRWSEHLDIDLIAIDEAHCISQWGHDFRPDYTQLSRLKELFPNVPIMALTATADRLTRDDISKQLKLSNPKVFINSFDRPNISLTVINEHSKRKIVSSICSLIDRYPNDSGIVYSMTRKGAEKIYAELSDRGYRVALYHAGMAAALRNESQQRFTNGDVQAVCATIAFGMGIDKSNIRWVVHTNMPRNIESYYQEFGRAGRDGSKAESIMFYSISDLITLQSFVDASGQKAINDEKLNRMREFTEAQICRRRILLSYFNEPTDHDCGNCDICLSPPQRFDGKIIVQKALSAIIRLKGQAGISMLVDVLKGAAKSELIAKNFHKIKTYGAGRDLSYPQWNYFITQMIQLGLIEIAYEDSNHLRVTPYGMQLLKNDSPIALSSYVQPSKTNKKKHKNDRIKNENTLLDILKDIRAKIAKQYGIAPYMVLSDKTIDILVQTKPTDFSTFATIEGINEQKAVRLWKDFVKPIRKWSGIKEALQSGTTYEETLLLLKNNTPDTIAKIKGISISTVYSHIIKLISENRFTDFEHVMTRDDYVSIMKIYHTDPSSFFINLDKQAIPGYSGKLALAISDAILRSKEK